MGILHNDYDFTPTFSNHFGNVCYFLASSAQIRKIIEEILSLIWTSGPQQQHVPTYYNITWKSEANSIDLFIESHCSATEVFFRTFIIQPFIPICDKCIRYDKFVICKTKFSPCVFILQATYLHFNTQLSSL